MSTKARFSPEGGLSHWRTKRAEPDLRTEFADRARDRDLEDLICSWRRLGDPNLIRLAIRLVRTLGADQT